jgi:hypothetical protein
VRYTCPFCDWAGSDDHAVWMAHHCSKPDPLLAVIDQQLEIERKARAWDALTQLVNLAHPDDVVVARIDLECWLEHPAPDAAPAKM